MSFITSFNVNFNANFNLIFIFTFGLLSYVYLSWGFKNLQREDMQVVAALPVRKTQGGLWEGINLTYYGVLTANAIAISIALFFILTGGAAIPLLESIVIITAIMAISMPASKIIARIVEKKNSTFTTGGASFVGFLAAPVVIFVVNATLGRLIGHAVPFMAVLSAMSIIYCTGEGLGRLACISFGCCYGKPLESCGPNAQKLFGRFHFVFSGKTKKISYAHGWDGLKMVPIQGITAVVNLFVAVVGMILYVNSRFSAALLTTVVLSHGWRILSEFVRSDYRGGKKISDYQKMCACSILFALILSIIPAFSAQIAGILAGETLAAATSPVGTLPTGTLAGVTSPAGAFAAGMPAGRTLPVGTQVNLYLGVKSIVKLPVVMFLQAAWICAALYLGKSKVTASRISIFVREDKI
ncbi:MAG: prolipoprotein diacylglyceryl transferase [Nitrospirae bacterium]|nr:prolipoprotein diacylglyceryl transferase [Nitrospirota bacterium]